MIVAIRKVPVHLLVILFVVSNGYGRPQNLRNGRQGTGLKRIPSAERLSYFDMELLEVMTRRQKDQNVVLSPISVKLLLGMLMEGAGGLSGEEIKHSLRLPSEDGLAKKTAHSWLEPYKNFPPDIKLNIATHLFVANGFNVNPQFAKTLRVHYAGNATKLDVSNSVAATDVVNDWVKSVTNGLIPALVSQGEIGPQTQGLIASAVYFKGSWLVPFEKTTNQCFYRTYEKCTNTVFMHKNDKVPYAYNSLLEADVVELPYKNERFSMVVVVPRGRVGSLSRDLLHEHNHILSQLKPTALDIHLPRFTASFEQDLIAPLGDLGISEVFGRDANLTGILEKGNGSLSISNVFHSAKVIVDEQGSEAAAATDALIVPLMSAGPRRFIADKPFIFFIRDSTSNTILFEGRIVDPERAAIQEESVVAKDSNVNDVTPNTIKMVVRRPGPPPPMAPPSQGRPNGLWPTDRSTLAINFQNSADDEERVEVELGVSVRPVRKTTVPPPLLRETPKKPSTTPTPQKLPSKAIPLSARNIPLNDSEGTARQSNPFSSYSIYKMIHYKNIDYFTFQ